MNVKIRRIMLKIKQKDLADKVGISREYLRRIENDDANPSKQIMTKLAAALDTSVQILFF